jgi:RNA polymerase sigma-70 factor (ECF subfamily)
MDLQAFEPSSNFDSSPDSDWIFQPEMATPPRVALRFPRPARPPRPLDFSREEDLVVALKDGDDEAFEFLVKNHRERMHAVARRFFSEEEDARDAVQEAFLAAYRAIDRFEEQAKISTWLHRVMVNACLMKLRSRRRKPEQSLDSATTSTLVSRTSGSAQDELESHEIATYVRDAIATLPEPHQSVLRLREIEERDTRETAAVLAISPAAVKTRLHRARTALRSRLEDGRERWRLPMLRESA